MSLESWQQLYYPITAKEAAELPSREVILHSLTKWRGLRPAALTEHGLIAEKHWIGCNTVRFSITGESCSLCAKHYDYDLHEPACCASCPLAQLEPSRTNCFEEYIHWRDTHDPEPMIALLERALATAQAN